MTRNELFKVALAKRLYGKRQWILLSFSLPMEAEEDYVPFYDYEPYFKDGAWQVSVGDKTEIITDAPKDRAVFDRLDKIVLTKDDLENISDKVETTIGRAIANAILFVFPFGKRVPYVNEEIKPKFINSTVAELLKTKAITAEEMKGKFAIAVGSLTVFTQICVPAATEKSLESPPGIEKARDEFVAANKHRMHTEEAAAELDQLLTQILKEHLKGDPSLRHLLKGKAFATVRKMMYGSIGMATTLDDTPEKIYTVASLKEGWKPEDLYAIANNLRTGSQLRGLETAIGGYTSKKLTRAYSNTRIKEDDCGSTIGLRVDITDDNHSLYVGRYLVGKDEPLTRDKLKGLIGKEVIMRDPNACKTKPPSFCAKCFGDGVGKAGVGLGVLMNSLGGQFLNIKLSLFHANELKLQEFKPSDRFF